MSLYTEYAPDGSYSHIIGAAVNQIDKLSEGLISLKIPAGTYALLSVPGSPNETIAAAWQAIWKDPISSQRAFTVDWEEYPGPFDPALPTYVKLYVALK